MSGEGPDSSYRNSTRAEGCVRAMKEPCCHGGPRTSLCTRFNTSSFFVALSTSGLWEASFSNYASPFKLSFISWEGWLLLPGAFTACRPPAPLVSLAKVTGVIFHHGSGPAPCIKCQHWGGGKRRGERAPWFLLPRAIILSTAVKKVPRGSHFHRGDYFCWIQS